MEKSVECASSWPTFPSFSQSHPRLLTIAPTRTCSIRCRWIFSVWCFFYSVGTPFLRSVFSMTMPLQRHCRCCLCPVDPTTGLRARDVPIFAQKSFLIGQLGAFAALVFVAVGFYFFVESGSFFIYNAFLVLMVNTMISTSSRTREFRLPTGRRGDGSTYEDIMATRLLDLYMVLLRACGNRQVYLSSLVTASQCVPLR